MSTTPRTTTSFYAALGVKRTSTDEEIREAYKRAVVVAHPDKPGGSPQKFRYVQAAYEAIKTADRRKKYDSTLRIERKVKNFSSIRPAALEHVKQGLDYKLLDGIAYKFEIAPDKMRCKYRHGDVVRGPTGDQGVIIGLAADGIYWVKNSEGFASLLFSPDFGGDKDIHLMYRDRKKASTGTTGNGASAQRDAQIRRDMLERTRMKKLETAVNKILDEEAARRKDIYAAIDLYFDDTRRSFKESMATVVSTVPKLTRLSWVRKPEDDGEKKSTKGENSDNKPDHPSGVENQPQRKATTPRPSRVYSDPHASTYSGGRLRPLEENQPTHSTNRGDSHSSSNSNGSNTQPSSPNTPRVSPLYSAKLRMMPSSTPHSGNTEKRAAARARSSSAGCGTRVTLTDRRSDLQKMLQEAKALRQQAQQTTQGR